MMQLPSMIDGGAWRGGHVQGIAVDTKKGFVYYSFTTVLVKTDLQGCVIGSVKGLVGHLGCIDFNVEALSTADLRQRRLPDRQLQSKRCWTVYI